MEKKNIEKMSERKIGQKEKMIEEKALNNGKVGVGKTYKVGNISNNNMLPGDRKGSPDESFFNGTLVFIDAGFVSKLSGYFGNGEYLVYDLKKLSENICSSQNLNCKEIFYYTAPPFQSNNPSKLEEKRKYGYDKFIKKLKSLGIIVREGRCQRLKIDGKVIYNQKAVDVLLVMDLMDVLIKYPQIKKIVLLATDSDFVPVIKNLKERGVRTILYTYYEKKRDTNFSRSNHLIKSVHKYVLLTKEDFLDSKLEGLKNE